jgi:hypothetical protein
MSLLLTVLHCAAIISGWNMGAVQDLAGVVIEGEKVL